MKIKDAIGIFDNVFTEAECKDLINILEEAKTNGETYKGESGQGGDTQIKKSTDFNILLNKKYSYASSSVMVNLIILYLMNI